MGTNNIEMIKMIAKGLGDLNDEVVYVGGSVVELYADSSAASDVRMTEDVDIVIELKTRHDFQELENRLRKKGFRNDISKGAPICRWVYNGIKVDVMPDDPTILGFTNKWYRPGIKKKIKTHLDNDTYIFILPPEFFLATKLEAAMSRGKKDLRFSHDFEDAIFIVNNNSSLLKGVKSSIKILSGYISTVLSEIRSSTNFEEAVECCMPRGESDRVSVVLKILDEMINTDEN